MNALFIPFFLVSFIASTVFAQTFTINTPPDVVQCEPLKLSWVGGTPGYFLSVLPANQPNALALMSFPEQNGTTLSWTVNITEGEGIFFNLRDSTGAIAQSASVTIQNSQDNSCINASALVPYPSTSVVATATSSSVSGSTSQAGSATATGTSGGSAKASNEASSTGTGAASSPSQAAAASQYAPVGTMAMAGVALAFVLVL